MESARSLIRRIGGSGALYQTVVTFKPITSSNSVPTLSGLFSGSAGSFASVFNTIFTMALSAGAILAVIRIAYAGWLYMGSADMWGNKGHAKDVFRDAIIGLLLLLAIYLILYQIDPCLVNLNFLRSLQDQSCTAA